MDLRDFYKLLNTRSQKLERDLTKFLVETSLKLEARGKKNATQDFYQPTTRSGKTRDYPLTGNLRRSINSKVQRSKNGASIILQAGGFQGGAIVNYADDLEFGVEPRIKPYFFLGRAVAEENNELQDRLEDFLQLELSVRGV